MINTKDTGRPDTYDTTDVSGLTPRSEEESLVDRNSKHFYIAFTGVVQASMPRNRLLGFMKGYFCVSLLWAVGNDKQTGQRGSLAMVENEYKYDEDSDCGCCTRGEGI